MSTSEAATYLELSSDSVLRYFKLGEIEGYRSTTSTRGRLRLYRGSVEEFDRKRKGQPTQPETES